MKTLKFLTLLSVYALSLLATPAFAVDGIDDNDHASLVKYYEAMANEAKVHLEEIKQCWKIMKRAHISMVGKARMSNHTLMPISVNTRNK